MTQVTMKNYKVLGKKYGSGGQVHSDFETVNADYASTTSDGDLMFYRKGTTQQQGDELIAGYQRGEWISFLQV